MNKKFTKGFTLIELLVVIAIIGILSAVVLASLNTARAKGADAAVKSNLDNMRAQAEIFYDSNGQTYTGVCADPNVSKALLSAAGQTGSTVDTTLTNAETATTVECHVLGTGASYAMQAPLKAVAGTYWCIDNTGNSKQEGAVMAASAVACI